jgi:hypothetical protein
MKMKRFVAALAIFSLSAIGITYAAGTDSNPVQNFFLGGTDLGSPNLNQVLALLVGPEGPPGPAGVAGADGFVGMNGQDGKDGLPGAPGEVGPAGADGANGRDGANGAPGAPGAPGAAVVTVALNAGDANCPQGGAKFTDANGTTTYACSGTGGSGGGSIVTTTLQPGDDTNCVNGGTKFVNGASTTYACNGSVTNGNLGLGNVALSACDTNVNVAIENEFDGESFNVSSITMTNVDNACANNKLVAYVPIKTSGPKKGSSTKYGVQSPADMVVCKINSVSVAGSAVVISDATATCKVKATNTTITLAEVNAEDIGTKIGLTLSN